MQKFNVLWYEDNIDHFDKIIETLNQHLHSHSRLFLFDHYDYYPDNLIESLFIGKYSLLFVDLNLKNGQKGTKVIEILRDYGAYVDILLYSNNPEQLLKLTEGKNYVEGVFRHAGLKGIDKKMCEVIDQVMYKEQMAIDREEKYKNSKTS